MTVKDLIIELLEHPLDVEVKRVTMADWGNTDIETVHYNPKTRTVVID